MTPIWLTSLAATRSDSLAAGIIYVIAIGVAIYYLWDCHKINRNLKSTYKREKGDN